jgi:hypothetical protein
VALKGQEAEAVESVTHHTSVGILKAVHHGEDLEAKIKGVLQSRWHHKLAAICLKLAAVCLEITAVCLKIAATTPCHYLNSEREGRKKREKKRDRKREGEREGERERE